MSKFIADDFKAIRRRVDEMKIQAEALLPNDCEVCEGAGFIERYSTHPPAFETCPGCYNPQGNPLP